MTRIGILLAGSFGLAAISRAAIYYAGVDSLALGLVLTMAVALVLGMFELLGRVHQFDALGRELAKLETPATNETLAKASPALRPFLRGRIEHVASPTGGPVFAPYVVGLLVMLGLLGTFMGLFETLRGAREALTSSTDVDALRAGLARPMQGLTRSFGTSAAGVAASAGLGLAIVLARRAEGGFVRALHAYTVGALAALTMPHRTLAALEAIVRQGEALPRAAGSLETAAWKLEHLEQAWRSAHKEAAEETARVLKTAADTVGADLESSIAKVVTATHAELRSVAESDAAARRARDEAHAGALERTREAAASAIASGHAQMDEAARRHEALSAQLESLVQRVDETATATAMAHARAAAEVTEKVTSHSAELGENLATAARLVSESAELLRAGGGELVAMAEAFSVAVDRHREASTVWLESLGTIEGAVENAGERAAAGALGDTLARMHEGFDRQLQVQLELFTQLRALRGLPAQTQPQTQNRSEKTEQLRAPDAPV